MPGILPMKVIKVGNSAQSRIAQACDRCRSKKIRCDGVRPTCSQCASVGFECRTSDKLSRRAFPRGYTESLEERIRQLETEVRELKDLLDEREEKIDMLSVMHEKQQRRPSVASVASGASGPDTLPSPDTLEHGSAPVHACQEDDSFRVEASPLLLGAENSDSFLMGPSSGHSFLLLFQHKLKEMGRPFTEFNPDAFLHVQGCAPLTQQEPSQAYRIPPRIFSDRCVHVFFQEFAPLFPVLHKPAFLRAYQDYVANPEKIRCPHTIAQLNLVFSIAGLSSDNPNVLQIATCEQQWEQAVQSVVFSNSMSKLQCLILALLYSAIRADNKRVQYYKGLAIGLSYRLGLHQSQKRSSFDALTLETRKKVFWSLYTLDCFTAATLGLPKLFKEEDIQTEYPSDMNDECVTETDHQARLPGEITRLSSGLALFNVSRILARVLEKNYPATPLHELSLQQMGAFARELDEWYDNLPTHLRLTFVQDKPSTDVTGSQSPILALAYHHIRVLIYRPAVGSSLGPKSAPALLSVVESSKRIIQTVQLLEERKMSFSFCLNKFDLVAICGLTLLYHVVDLKRDGKLIRDVERLVNLAVKMLEQVKAPGSADLARVSATLICVKERQDPAQSLSPQSLARSSSNPSKVDINTGRHARKGRRMTSPGISLREAEPPRPRPRPTSDHALSSSPVNLPPGPPAVEGGSQSWSCRSIPNLDYLSLSNTPSHSRPCSPTGMTHTQFLETSMSPSNRLMCDHGSKTKMTEVPNSEWETILGSMDGGLYNVYDAIYGGASFMAAGAPGQTHSFGSLWSPDSWDTRSNSVKMGALDGDPTGPQSVLSLSEDSLSSGEDVAPSELSLSVGSTEFNTVRMLETLLLDMDGASH